MYLFYIYIDPQPVRQERLHLVGRHQQAHVTSPPFSTKWLSCSSFALGKISLLGIFCSTPSSDLCHQSSTFNFFSVSSVLPPTFTLCASGPSTCPSGCATTAFLAAAAAARFAGSPLSLTFLTFSTFSGG